VSTALAWWWLMAGSLAGAAAARVPRVRWQLESVAAARSMLQVHHEQPGQPGSISQIADLV
jgi:hypothetical protein